MARQRAAARDAALLEARVRKMCEVLGGALEDTKGNVEKKQARTYEEITAELEDEDPVSPSSRCFFMFWSTTGGQGAR